MKGAVSVLCFFSRVVSFIWNSLFSGRTLFWILGCFLCAGDRCERIQIYIQTAVQMGLNIYVTAMPAAISVMVCILKGLSRFTQGNQMQFIRSDTGGSSDVQKLRVKESFSCLLGNNTRCVLWSDLFARHEDETPSHPWLSSVNKLHRMFV